MNNLLSVITPVYNAEKTIHRTIKSVLAQTYENFELILINDGSTDKSLEICNKYAKSDNRIRVFSQENAGPSSARNLGLEEATGEYIVFLDADDWIIPDAYEIMLNEAKVNFIDVLEYGYKEEINGVLFSVNNPRDKNDLFKDEEAKKYALDFIYSPLGKRIKPYTCLRLINRNLIEDNNIRFNPIIRRTEDYLFLSKVHIHAKTIRLMSDLKLYIYVNNVESITHNYVKGYWNMVLEIYDNLYNYRGKISNKEFLRRIEKMLVYRCQVSLANETISKESFVNRYKNNKKSINNEDIRRIVRGISILDGIKEFGKSFVFIKLKLPALALFLFSHSKRNRFK